MKTILVAEDEADILIMLIDILELDGYKVHSASDGQAAWDYLQAVHNCPDILITDIMMPRMTGLDLIKRIREDEKCKHMPVLVYSASGHFREEVSNLGGKFTPKPFDLDTLLSDVFNAITKE